MQWQYKNKKILIWGIGITGISCINFFLRKGIFPRIIDSQNDFKKLFLIKKIPPCISIKIGENIQSWIFESDLIVISPGVSLFHPLLIKASQLGIEIIGDIELFCRETKKPIIAITGSNGKTTVTTMLHKIAQNSHLNVLIGGNIGIPVLNILEKKSDLFILELSSFQLETTYSLQAKIAIILNITPDHIDRYPLGFKSYKQTKLKIYNNAETCIINTKHNFLKEIKAINVKKKITFGIDHGEYHLVQNSKNSWLCHKHNKLLNLTKTSLNTISNFENALAVLAISNEIGFSKCCSLKIISTFNGLNYRFQLIHQKNKIKWINDSKSTNIGSTIAAINNVQTTGTIRLLLGGNRKSANFNILKKHLKNKKVKIYCYGQDRNYISNIFSGKSICVYTLTQAMFLIKKHVKPNDVVLFSPACSSTDQFSNFEERGRLFSKLVKKMF